MVLVTHIIIALTSVAHSTLLFFVPTQRQLTISVSLVAMTLASGSYIVFSTGAHLLQACLTGLFYLGIVSMGIVSTWYKLAHEPIRNK